MHYDGSGVAGGEASQRELTRAEARQLEEAANEFKIGAILASLQDCFTLCGLGDLLSSPIDTLRGMCEVGRFSFSKDSGRRL